MEITRVVAINIEKARAGMSREELAKRSKTTYQSIRDIEEGRRKPSVDMLSNIANGLGLSVADLFKEDLKVLKMSPMVQRIAAIPDEVYDLAIGVPREDSAWDTVRQTLEIAQERVKKNQLSKNQIEPSNR